MGTVVEFTSENIGSIGKVFKVTGQAINGVMNIAAYPFSILGEGTKYVSDILSG